MLLPTDESSGKTSSRDAVKNDLKGECHFSWKDGSNKAILLKGNFITISVFTHLSSKLLKRGRNYSKIVRSLFLTKIYVMKLHHLALRFLTFAS